MPSSRQAGRHPQSTNRNLPRNRCHPEGRGFRRPGGPNALCGKPQNGSALSELVPEPHRKNGIHLEERKIVVDLVLLRNDITLNVRIRSYAAAIAARSIANAATYSQGCL